MEDADQYRCRHIYLKQSDNPDLQAEAACAALTNIEGILLASAHSEFSVHIIYSLDQLSFEIVIELLDELNFEMDNSFLMSLRNTIYCYMEDTARDNREFEHPEDHHAEGENSEKPHEDKDQYWEDYR